MGRSALGDRARRGLAADQVLVDAEAFERAMQPLGPGRIGVAVGDEGAVFQRDGLGHDHAHCAASCGSAATGGGGNRLPQLRDLRVIPGKVIGQLGVVRGLLDQMHDDCARR